jgi:hypothetical protein
MLEMRARRPQGMCCDFLTLREHPRPAATRLQRPHRAANSILICTGDELEPGASIAERVEPRILCIRYQNALAEAFSWMWLARGVIPLYSPRTRSALKGGGCTADPVTGGGYIEFRRMLDHIREDEESIPHCSMLHCQSFL